MIAAKMNAGVAQQRPAADAVQLGGVLGEAIEASRRGRLSHFIVDEHSPAIALFQPERVEGNTEGDWYGEHAGKWLYATAKAAARSGDEVLTQRLCQVADYLVSRQDADGYLGNYAPSRRFMHKQPPKPPSWNGEPALRTWDIWTHSYLVLGLVETWRHAGQARHLDAACRIGDLCLRVLRDSDVDITDLGNHFGMSATVLMDPAIELYGVTGEARYLELAQLVADQADRHPPLRLLSRALEGGDASEIATGKAYQLCWNLVGLAKLHRATGDARYLAAVESLWHGIREHHLTLGGGPWGGVAHRSREVFNPASVFSPQGYVETCSILSWLQLNGELLRITGGARFAEEIERTAYNDLLGAADPNGEDWCYYSFPNGQRVHTTYWRCCKSSGAMAWEELPAFAYGADGQGVYVNLLGPGCARVQVGDNEVEVTQTTEYPFDGRVVIGVEPQQASRFELRVRMPEWAAGAKVEVNGTFVEREPVEGEWLRIDREWQSGDTVALDLPMAPRLHRRTMRNVQESRAPDGSPVQQQVLRYDYAAITRGPLVYATDLIDGFKTDESLRLPEGPLQEWITETAGHAQQTELDVRLGYRAPLRFVPYYRAGGRHDGAWRLVWMSLAPAPGAVATNSGT